MSIDLELTQTLLAAQRIVKRGDQVAEQVKRWINERELRPGDKLPKEAELQALFSVSKSTMREALKSLEVQGLIRISTGPNGGATIAQVPFERTCQFVQNYLFFQDLSVPDIYELRKLIEPELAVGALGHLRPEDFAALEKSIAFCSPPGGSLEMTQLQRQEDLNFHEILARVNPNPIMRMTGQLVNELLRHVVKLGGHTDHARYEEFGHANVHAHRSILQAVRRGDAKKLHRLMYEHILEAQDHVMKLQPVVQRRLLLDSDMDLRIAPSNARDAKRGG